MTNFSYTVSCSAGHVFLAIDVEQGGSCLMECMDHELRQCRRRDKIYEGSRSS